MYMSGWNQFWIFCFGVLDQSVSDVTQGPLEDVDFFLHFHYLGYVVLGVGTSFFLNREQRIY